MRDNRFIPHFRRIDQHRFWVYSEKRFQEILEEYPEDQHCHEVVRWLWPTDLIAERMGIKSQTTE